MGFTVIDFETTGLNFLVEQVIEISALKLDSNLNEIGTFNTFVRLRKELPEFITNLTGITEEHLAEGMGELDAFSLLRQFVGRDIVVAQYAPFDLAYMAEHGIIPRTFYCTKSLTALAEPNESSSLIPTCERLGITLEGAHRAINDCRATAEVLRYRFKQGFDRPNTLVVAEGRALNYIPPATRLIYTKTGNLIADFNLQKGDN
jgi:DNA polymerase III alpha subunit (gram-positive type)